MSKSQVPEANAWVGFFFIKDITPELAAGIEKAGKAVPHKHEYDEMYLFVGDKGAITAEVTLGDEVYEVEAPACVYLPKGIVHGFKPIRAKIGLTGGIFPIVFNGEYKILSEDEQLRS